MPSASKSASTSKSTLAAVEPSTTTTKRKAGAAGAADGADGAGHANAKRARPSETEADEAGGVGAKGVGQDADDDDDDDEDWLQFQKDIAAAPSADAEGEEATDRSGQQASPPRPAVASYTTAASATIEAQPQLIKSDANGGDGDGADADADADDDGEETEEQKRQRIAQEEREEILARLDEEQRLQDEAQER